MGDFHLHFLEGSRLNVNTHRSVCGHSTAQFWIHFIVDFAVIRTLDLSILGCTVPYVQSVLCSVEVELVRSGWLKVRAKLNAVLPLLFMVFIVKVCS